MSKERIGHREKYRGKHKEKTRQCTSGFKVLNITFCTWVGCLGSFGRCLSLVVRTSGLLSFVWSLARRQFGKRKKGALCRSPTAGKAIGVCKTTGGKTTGRCREGFEGARWQSWKQKKKLYVDPRQLAKPVAFARQQVERPLDAAGKGLKGSGSLGSGKKGLCADPRQLEKPCCKQPFQKRVDAEGFEGAKRQSWERKKRALCRSPTAGN